MAPTVANLFPGLLVAAPYLETTATPHKLPVPKMTAEADDKSKKKKKKDEPETPEATFWLRQRVNHGWHRARIVEYVDTTTVKVLYVDYGNIEVMSLA